MIILGRLREAEPEARTAVVLDETNTKAQYLLGYILAHRPETQAAAEEHLKYAARAFPEAHSALAALHRATGRKTLAETEEKENLGKQPNGKSGAQ